MDFFATSVPDPPIPLDIREGRSWVEAALGIKHALCAVAGCPLVYTYTR